MSICKTFICFPYILDYATFGCILLICCHFDAFGLVYKNDVLIILPDYNYIFFFGWCLATSSCIIQFHAILFCVFAYLQWILPPCLISSYFSTLYSICSILILYFVKSTSWIIRFHSGKISLDSVSKVTSRVKLVKWHIQFDQFSLSEIKMQKFQREGCISFCTNYLTRSQKSYLHLYSYWLSHDTIPIAKP